MSAEPEDRTFDSFRNQHSNLPISIMTPQTQKALLLPEKFAAFVVGDRQVDQPGPGEVLIKVHSAGVNPAEWKVQKYGILYNDFPTVLGSDIAGEIEALGEGVVGFEKGDRVFCQCGKMEAKWGGYQKYAIAQAVAIAKIPENLSYDEAATIPLALHTAYRSIYYTAPYGLGIASPLSSDEALGKYTGESVLVLGGSSAVGQMAIQLLKLSGFSFILTTASLHNAEDLKALGATHVVDRKLSFDDLSTHVQQILGNHPLKYAFDAIGTAETHKTGVDLLGDGGLIATVNPMHLNIDFLAALKRGDGIAALSFHLELYKPSNWDVVRDWLESGLIKPNRVEVLPNGLEGIIDGLKRLEAGTVSRTKLVAHPQETE